MVVIYANRGQARAAIARELNGVRTQGEDRASEREEDRIWSADSARHRRKDYRGGEQADELFEFLHVSMVSTRGVKPL